MTSAWADTILISATCQCIQLSDQSLLSWNQNVGVVTTHQHFVHNVYDNMFIIILFLYLNVYFLHIPFDFFYNNDISVDLHWILWLIECNFLEYSSSINLFKTCLSSGFTDKYWKILTQIEFPRPLRSCTYILLDWGYVFNWYSLPEVCTYIVYPHDNSSIFCVGWN